MALKVIALTGPKGSGKDTVGALIKETYKQYDPETIAFADPVKQAVRHIFNLGDESAYSYDRLKRATLKLKDEECFYTIEGRRLVREIGMLMRSYDEKQFTQYVFDTINKHPDRLWIITDMRFDNEYCFVKNRLNAKMIKIIRPKYDYDGHITERAFDDHLVDKVLMNDGDLQYLKYRTASVMSSIMESWQ
jgi:hypothetical protein